MSNPFRPSSSTPPVAPPVRPSIRSAARTLTGLLALGVAGTATAQPAAPEDWPCVQVLVPEVSVATLWPEPIDPAAAAAWRDDAALGVLARQFAALEDGDETARDEAEAALAAFVEATPENELGQRLGRLAFATVELVDERRSDYLDGIRRFTRGQIALAERIEASLNAQAEGDGTVGADAIALARADSGIPREDAAERLHWQERLYDQRERQVRALCERPVRLEEALSASLRAFAASLPASG